LKISLAQSIPQYDNRSLKIVDHVFKIEKKSRNWSIRDSSSLSLHSSLLIGRESNLVQSTLLPAGIEQMMQFLNREYYSFFKVLEGFVFAAFSVCDLMARRPVKTTMNTPARMVLIPKSTLFDRY